MNFEADTTNLCYPSPSPISLGNKPFLYLQLMILMYPWAMTLGLAVILVQFMHVIEKHWKIISLLEVLKKKVIGSTEFTHWWDPGQDTMIVNCKRCFQSLSSISWERHLSSTYR